MTDYTEVRMRISWVVLASALVLLASASDQDESLSDAVAAVTRSLQHSEKKVPALLHFADSDEGSQEYQLRGTTLVVKRRSKTPLLFGDSPPAVPPPVEIRSDVLSVKDAEEAKGRAGRQLSRVGRDGVVEITGVRVPDDENDRRFTWRNARVIKNVLVPGEAVPAPAPVSSASLVFGQRQQRQVEVTVLEQGPTAVRAPILQYAHPELGVQPALQHSTSRELEVAPQPQRHTQHHHQQQPSTLYYAQENPQDIHNDHSPYQFEPAESHRPFEADPASAARPAYVEPKRPVRKPVPYKDFGDYEKLKYKPKWYAEPNTVNSYATFYAPEEPRPLWQRLSQMIRDNVNSGYAQVASMARPVWTAASKAIGTTSTGGNPNTRAQEKTGVAAPVVFGAAPLVVPAIGLVAGGAFLGLGAAAVSRLLETTQVVHGKSLNRRRRALLTGGTPLLSLQDQLAHDEDRIAFTNTLAGASRPKDSFLAQLSRYGHSRWREDTPCAKRIFCDVMTQQPQDASVLMEKRIAIFLSLLNEGVARALSGHMDEVLDAVRKHDCSAFLCHDERQIGVSVATTAFNANVRHGPR